LPCRLDDFLRRYGNRLRNSILRLRRLAHRLVAPWTSNGLARTEDPSDPRYWRSSEKAAALEQPGMLAVELLERVVGQHGRIDLLGDAQQERVSAPDGPGGGMDKLTAERGLLETRSSEGSIR